MAYSNKLSAALLIFSFLLDSSTFSDACSTCKPAIPPPSPPACPPPPSAKTPPKVPSPKPKTPTPSPKPKTPPSPKPKTPPSPKPKTPPSPKPKTPTPSPSPSMESCPRDTLKLGVCADLLGLVNVQLGSPASSPCCTLLEGLTDLEAAICLCTALKASVLGINLNVPISLGVLISACQKDLPPDFQCK